MSLEASRYLWNARVDPRRRTYAMGIYSHVLDQWGIIDDQPLVLHQRQAGAAIEGVVRQTAAALWQENPGLGSLKRLIFQRLAAALEQYTLHAQFIAVCSSSK